MPLEGRGRLRGNQKSDFSHAGTASTAVRMPRVRWNNMKPGVHIVTIAVKVQVHVVRRSADGARERGSSGVCLFGLWWWVREPAAWA
jgi:hypothetical protein